MGKSITDSLDRIQRRLGSERHRRLKTLFEEAFSRQQSSGESDLHTQWIEILLEEYYDPMYDYQLGKKRNRILFRGEKKALLAYLNTFSEISR